MTRAELYSLVLEKPIVHVAKRFGISDVGLRKICVKHDVPTPPLGYWAKLAHGKKVKQPPLPPLKENTRDKIFLTARADLDLPESVAHAEHAALSYESMPENKIIFPTASPKELHQYTMATEKLLRKAKPDHEGFVICDNLELPTVRVAPPSVGRATLLLDTLIKALVSRRHAVTLREGAFRLVVDNEFFVLAIHETRDKKDHEPTAADLTRQAEYDQNSKRLPQWYPPKQVWPRWDYVPSGRLCMEISDPTQYRWNGENIVGRWYDRRNSKVEDHFGSAMVALARAAALVKHRRVEAVEKERIEAEQADRRRRDEARRERAKKRREFLLKESEEYARFSALAAFEAFLASKVGQEGIDPIDRMARVLRGMVLELDHKFGREALNAEIERLGLFADDDLT
jgi:hypothetical protein